MISENRVSIIGAGGHVGLPLSLVISSSGFDVTGIDIDSERVSQLMEGHVPFVEYGAEELLEQDFKVTGCVLQLNLTVYRKQRL